MKFRRGFAAGLAASLAVGFLVAAGPAVATTRPRLINPSTGLPLGVMPTSSQRARAQRALVRNPQAIPPNPHLKYFGGPVMSNPNVVSLLWPPDPSDATQTFIPQVTGGTSPNMSTWFSHVANSAHFSWLNEYNTPAVGGTGQSIGYGNFYAQYSLPSQNISPSTLVTDTQIQAAITNAYVTHQIPSATFDAQGQPNTFFAVFFPKNVVIDEGNNNLSGVVFCAYHGSVQVTPGVYVPYAVLPDPTSSGMNVGCGQGSSFQILQGYTSHELVEAITDPQVGQATTYGAPLAWYDNQTLNNSDYGEIGDICNGIAGSVLGTDAATYTVQTEWSNSANDCISQKTATAPSSASNLAGTRLSNGPNNGVHLTWSPPNDGGSALLSQMIYRSTDPSSVGTAVAALGPVTNSYDDAHLTLGTTYYFRVTGTNVYGGGTYSNQAAVLVATTPGTPTGVAASLAGDRSILFSWQGVPTDGGAAITSWNVYRYDATHPNGVLVGSAPPTDPWFTDSGLTVGTAYGYAVAAVNVVGESSRSSETTPLTAQGVPDAPTALNAAVSGSGQVTLTWSAPAADGGSPLADYTIFRSQTPGDQGTQIGTVSATDPLTFTDTGLPAGETEYYLVIANNLWGASAWPTAASTTAATIPVAPTGVVALAAVGGSAVVSWTPTSDGGRSITNYHAQVSGSGRSCDTSGTTCTITGLTVGQQYKFSVYATNSLGDSALSTLSADFVAADVPTAPAITSARPGNRNVTVSWTVPTSDGALPISGYTVRALPGSATCTSDANNTSCVVKGLTNGQHYTFTVTAANSLGSSAPSATSQVATPRTIPGTPRSLKAAYSASHKTTVTWTTPASSGGAAVTKYFVRWSANNKKWTAWTATSKRSAVHVGFKKGVKGYVQVVASNIAGRGMVAKLTVKPTK